MRIISDGVTPENWKAKISCEGCKATLEINADDIEVDRTGYFVEVIVVTCPVCSSLNFLHPGEIWVPKKVMDGCKSYEREVHKEEPWYRKVLKRLVGIPQAKERETVK